MGGSGLLRRAADLAQENRIVTRRRREFATRERKLCPDRSNRNQNAVTPAAVNAAAFRRRHRSTSATAPPPRARWTERREEKGAVDEGGSGEAADRSRSSTEAIGWG